MSIRKLLAIIGCSVFAIGVADAAQIASTQYVENAVSTKSDLQGTGAVEVATVDATGQYIRSGTVLDTLATDAELGTATTTVINNVNEIVDAIETDISAKADKVVPAVAGNIAGLDASGNLTDSGFAPGNFLQDADLQGIWENLTQIEEDAAASDIYFRDEIRKNSELDATIRDLIVNQEDANGDGVRDGEVYVVRDRLDKLEDGVDGAEMVSNRVDEITSATIGTAYPSVAAIRQYVLPIPPTACSSQQCVLSVDQGSGEPYWEIVAFPEP